ncbi:epidermal growth factor receptor kinase [Echinococcus multilocularis]|uniref:Epidermal growth factor receptor kinase n=1 Tax=Echinococcus multilocularis TaxID=6211 RepID=A0A087VYN4_ECHMU|nr:epidermal growth factor receptor kinase [Echinococcus multilocularis]
MSIHSSATSLPRSAAVPRAASHDHHGGGTGGNVCGRIYWQHEVEHLSTLVTPASRPPPDPESSLKRLHQLADQKQLTITPVNLLLREQKAKRELLVTNIENGDICECIPLEDIITPIYKESNDQTDAFNNLLMFNVNASIHSKGGPPQHEMHIFQCISTSAHDIVGALVDAQEQELVNSHLEPYAEVEEPHRATRNKFSENGNEDLTAQQLKEKALIDGEILLLNMCFDDIESYVGHIYKLQRARWQNPTRGGPSDDNVSVSGADFKGKEKKKRRFIFKKRSRSPKNKDKNDMPRVTSNTSLASEVEIPISDDELIDLFEKIKFSVILLSRLQGYVTEPNPPLLTHKLFSMMKQPIDFIRDPVTGVPEMARKVISPLFPESAIRLIQNSLIEPELSLWRELGNGWCLPKEQWQAAVPTYIPQFKCGFKPQPEQYHHTLFDVPPPKKSTANGGMHSSFSRSKLASGPEVRSHVEYLQYLRSKKAKIARVMRDFLAESDQEISLKAGEYVEVLNDSLNWKHLRNRRGSEGYAPYTILDYNVA